MCNCVIQGIDGSRITVDRDEACFFSGHRTIRNEDIGQMTLMLDRELESLFYAGYTTFLCGAARGFDLLAASAVLRLRRTHPSCGIRLICLIPCAGQNRHWNEGEQALYRAILSRSENCLLQTAYDSGCMRRRNQLLVSSASVGVVYLLPDRRISGTAMTVRMARDAHIPVHNLYTMLHPDNVPAAVEDTDALFTLEETEWDDMI